MSSSDPIQIEYRDASYFEAAFGRKRIHRVEARIGDIMRIEATKPEAKAAVLEALALQAKYAFERRYLASGDTVFALSYCDGWRYDIIHAGKQGGSTVFDASGPSEALQRMRHHFDQYVETGVKPEKSAAAA